VFLNSVSKVDNSCFLGFAPQNRTDNNRSGCSRDNQAQLACWGQHQRHPQHHPVPHPDPPCTPPRVVRIPTTSRLVCHLCLAPHPLPCPRWVASGSHHACQRRHTNAAFQTRTFRLLQRLPATMGTSSSPSENIPPSAGQTRTVRKFTGDPSPTLLSEAPHKIRARAETIRRKQEVRDTRHPAHPTQPQAPAPAWPHSNCNMACLLSCTHEAHTRAHAARAWPGRCALH
jgi:hypothetical protein